MSVLHWRFRESRSRSKVSSTRRLPAEMEWHLRAVYMHRIYVQALFTLCTVLFWAAGFVGGTVKPAPAECGHGCFGALVLLRSAT
jgi:hypothetical protein